jgi:hypothetical protein
LDEQAREVGRADAWQSRLMLVVQLLGLVGTGWLIRTYWIEPRLTRQSFASLAGEALFVVLLTWVGSAIIAFFIYLIGEPQTLASVVMRKSSTAAWFAPAIILLSTLSPFGLFAGLALVVAAARLLVDHWRLAREEGAPRWNPLPAFGASLVLQSALVAVLWRKPMLAAIAVALSGAIITALVLIRGDRDRERPRPLPPSSQGVILTILLAAAVSTGGLKLREFGTGSGDGGQAGSSDAVAVTELDESQPEQSWVGSGGFPGVILRVADKPHAVLIALPPRALLAKSARMREPFSIPFTGEYWMFQPPMMRPPARTSVVRKGTPLELTFHTTNGTTMLMEARQQLVAPIGISCCEGLDVQISRQGESPLRLGVTLIDSLTKHTMNLGFADVGSAAEQTLNYPIHPSGSIDQFDAIRIVYGRDFQRMSFSVRLAIQGFVLTPRSR